MRQPWFQLQSLLLNQNNKNFKNGFRLLKWSVPLLCCSEKSPACDCGSNVLHDIVTSLQTTKRISDVHYLDLTSLPLATILGPFGVYLLKFTLDTLPGSLMGLEFVVPHTSYGKGPGNEDAYTLEVYRMYPMIAISSLPLKDFLLLSCLHVRLRKALLNMTKYMSFTGIIRNFGRLRDAIWNVFNQLSRLNFTRESFFKG